MSADKKCRRPTSYVDRKAILREKKKPCDLL